MIIDTHAHLTHPLIFNDISNILKTASINGINKIITVGCSIKEAQDSITLAQKYRGIYATAGLYPHDNRQESLIPDKQKLQKIKNLIKNKKIVAVGECGLDFTAPPPWEVKRSENEQVELFKKQIELAISAKLPIIIHSRNAPQETIQILKEYPDIKAVWHCFSENLTIAEKAIEMGLFISFTGIVTYPSAKLVQKVAKKIPPERIMIETDSPYLVPQTERVKGIKVNVPCYAKIIAEKIANIRGVSLESITRTTCKNAEDFFNI